MHIPVRRLAPALLVLTLLAPPVASPLPAQEAVRDAAVRPGEARRRWERLCLIRQEKFDLILPAALRDNGIDMWIVVMREGLLDPLWEDLGRGYVGGWAYWVFTDRGGDRVERAVFGVGGYGPEQCPVYDHFASPDDLRAWVAERDPARIGVNMAADIGIADALSHTSYLYLRETLGAPFADRLTSAQKLVSDFRARRTASEIAAFAEAGEMSREIAERAFSNEVIRPGVTTLEDVAWWMRDQLLARGLDSSFDMPSVYVTGPEGIAATSTDRIIQRGDLLMLDWGVGFLNFYTDMKRVAYVLRDGETEAPEPIRRAFANGLRVRDAMKSAIKTGRTAQQALDETYAAIEAAGFTRMREFNRPRDDASVEVIIGPHSVGNWGHGIGPSLAFFNPEQLTYEVVPGTLISVELFAYTPNPDWGGRKVRIPLEDDAVVTARGVEWLYPPADRILLVR